SLSVPIYLGDSLGWDQREDLLSVDQLVIPTEVGDQLLSGELVFPERLLENSATFDDLVETLVDESGRAAGKATNKLSEGTVRRLALTEADLPDLNANFRRLKELHEADRNHIWSYYIRNVARPAWLAREENRVDVLVGNPPWLSYRHMTDSMQKRFKTLAKDRSFWHNETTATHQDLAGLFVARAVERYLKSGGRLAFVVPHSVIDRDYWSGFRSGRFQAAAVAFAASWDLRRIRPHLFPRGSAVIFGARTAESVPMPGHAFVWTGRAPHHHASHDSALLLHQAVGELAIGSDTDKKSPYASVFSQGANLVPRVLFRVEPAKASALGVPAGKAAVESKRSVSEKKPWKEIPNLQGTIETQFLWPVALGEQITPFLMREPEEFVIPLTQKGEVLHGDHPRIDGYPGLADWIRKAEEIWEEHASSKMSLAEQINHMRKLSQQLPAPAVRVVYAASGMHVSAALITDPRVILEHAVYWATVSTVAEGHFLVGILNAPVLTELVRPLMSYGKDERHIDKHVWKLPIPTYDPHDELHVRISTLSAEIAQEISHLELKSTNFVMIRKQLRAHLAASTSGKALDALVAQLLDVEATTPADDAADHPLLIRTADEVEVSAECDVEVDVD
ncbi:MAG: hypothetical protein L0H31_16195, partial [Nocardioidaceae bacterium]|nr:hypothetical protein [Nocardioidaceae bacterium]